MSSARECELLWCYNVITCERVVLQCDKGRPGSEKVLLENVSGTYIQVGTVTRGPMIDSINQTS